MTDPLAESFDIFDEHVRLSAPRRDIAEFRGREISALLSHDNRILECRQIGSLTRSTAIERFSDVDILAIFDPNEADCEKPKNLLDLIEQIVGTTSGYSISRTSVNVSLRYHDWPSIDVLPGWPIADGEHQSFYVPSGGGEKWQRYFPDRHDSIVRDGSERLGPKFKKIIRVVKWWNQVNGRLLESCEIEELTDSLFESEIPEYPEAIYEIFTAIVNLLTEEERKYNDPDLSIPGPVSAETARILSRRAYELAIERSDYRDIGFLFRRLFGEQFPTVLS